MKYNVINSLGEIVYPNITLSNAFDLIEKHAWLSIKYPKRMPREDTLYMITRMCVNAQLRKFNLCYSDIMIGGQYAVKQHKKKVTKYYFFGLFHITNEVTKEIPWYQYYSFNTHEEFLEWKKYCINLYRKEMKVNYNIAETWFTWFNLSYGIKQNYQIPV